MRKLLSKQFITSLREITVKFFTVLLVRLAKTFGLVIVQYPEAFHYVLICAGQAKYNIAKALVITLMRFQR